MCGGFNSNLFRNAKNWISGQQEKGKSVKIITVGKKASSFYRKTDLDVIVNFDGERVFLTGPGEFVYEGCVNLRSGST